ncbi:unnamed protein product [Closterium sp. NIES-54]
MLPGTRESLDENSLTSYILQNEAMQEAEQPTELLPQASYAALTKPNRQQEQRGKPGRGGSRVSLGLEAGEDFHVVAAAVQANPMAMLLDSGCSHHLMGTKAVFVDMAPSDGVKHVRGFNGALEPVKGCRTVALEGEVGKQVLIPDVLYVPGVQVNLLSAGKLKESGVQLQGDGDEMLLVAATGEVLGRGRYTGRVLYTNLRPCSTRPPSTEVVAQWTIVSATKSTLDRLHARLALVSVDRIKSSAKHKVAAALDIKTSTEADPPCVSCVGGKLARHTFPDKGSDAEEALADVHIDLCGPFQEAAKDGSLHFLLGNRHTQFVWAMPVAKKSDVLREFQQRLEFLGKEFTNFVNGKGIVHDLTCPYTPQQNGMAEREMRTVVESVCKMLLHMGVQHHSWHLALRQAVWRGGKLAPKARWGLHLGVSLESEGWEVLDLSDNKVVTSVKVIFYGTLSLVIGLRRHLCRPPAMRGALRHRLWRRPVASPAANKALSASTTMGSRRRLGSSRQGSRSTGGSSRGAVDKVAADGAVDRGAIEVNRRYEEDVYVNNHTSVWGSFWKVRQWGYACCHQMLCLSYCIGSAGIQATEAAV